MIILSNYLIKKVAHTLYRVIELNTLTLIDRAKFYKEKSWLFPHISYSSAPLNAYTSVGATKDAIQLFLAD
ncbi:hypothetical protein MTP04_37580 [Lysinibacillus sp. PLM2]|nr:hypothetical protein MTP04_37580 [Lysinibacillus sp. PLM2]